VAAISPARAAEPLRAEEAPGPVRSVTSSAVHKPNHLKSLLFSGDAEHRGGRPLQVEAVLQMRKTQGNRAVQRLLQRQPQTPNQGPASPAATQGCTTLPPAKDPRAIFDNLCLLSRELKEHPPGRLNDAFHNNPPLTAKDNGAVVQTLQQALLDTGEALPKFGADGNWGDETTKAVISFQSKNGIPPGGWEAGRRTLLALDRLLGGSGPTPPHPVPTCPGSTRDFPADPSTILGLQEGDGVVENGNITPEELAQRPRVHRLQVLLNQNLPGANIEENCSFDEATEVKLLQFQDAMANVTTAARTDLTRLDTLVGSPATGGPGMTRGKVDLPTANALLGKTPPPVPPRPAYLPRDPDEKTKSFLASPTVTFSRTSQELLTQGFAVSSKNLMDVPGSAAWQEAMSFMAGDPNAKVSVTGFTDCAGNDVENFTLQQQRAEAVKQAMPALVQSRVIASGPAGVTEFLAGNSTAAERALNRAVRVRFLSSPPASEGPFDRLVNGAHSLDEYLFLVRALEQRLGLTAPVDTAKALSVIRQIYFGTASWTLASGRIPQFSRIITSTPWSPGDDPTPKLTLPLMQALRNSQVVEGTDVGHVFTGLDAMMNPQQVRLGGISTGLINEEVASWSRDVGSAAARWAVDMFFGRALSGKPVGTQDDYFNSFAGADDLRGDIDAYAMRVGFSPGSPPSSLVMSAVRLSGPLSEALLQYYRVARSGLAQAHGQRFKTFLESYGGIVNGGSLSNSFGGPGHAFAEGRAVCRCVCGYKASSRISGKIRRSQRATRRPALVERACGGRECSHDYQVGRISEERPLIQRAIDTHNSLTTATPRHGTAWLKKSRRNGKRGSAKAL